MKQIPKITCLFVYLFAAWAAFPQVNPPVLQSVSVMNEAGDVFLTWLPSPDSDVQGYIIYEYIGDFHGINTIRLDEVNNLQTNYLALNTEANTRSISYVIAAFRIESGDTIRSALTAPQRTVFLHVEWDVCETRNLLHWSSYSGWGVELINYEVSWHLQGESNIQNEGMVLPPDTTFIHYNPPLNQNVCYFITATHSQGFESFSNRRCTTTSALLTPSYIHAAYATVNASEQIELVFYPDNNTQTDSYEIYRSESLAGNYELLSGITRFPPSSITFTDEQASVEQVHFYKLRGLNECRIPVVESNVASNIRLQSSHNRGVNSLTWNAYETWLGGVSEYRIYRFTDDQIPVLIATVNSNVTSIQDEPALSLKPGQSGLFCYFITAREGNTNPHGMQSESISNRVCEISEPEVFIPNAFTPDGDGINDEFTIFFTYLPKTYHLVIYDRWRNIVFESRNTEEHWKGALRGGRKAAEGVYTFVLVAEMPSGNKIQKTGQVALIYP